jgi:hypothetical protein
MMTSAYASIAENSLTTSVAQKSASRLCRRAPVGIFLILRLRTEYLCGVIGFTHTTLEYRQRHRCAKW